jgi:predicted transcriptional regulator
MSQDETQVQVLVQFFKALADETRLRMVGLLAGGERSVEELAAALGVREPTVSHHLGKLKALGLVRMTAQGTTHLYRLDAETLRAMNRDLLTRERLAGLAADLPGDAWQQQVLRNFLDGERLREIPASRKKRDVILDWLADRFEHGVRYPEPEVNAIIKRHHPDSAALRRELVDGRWMAREAGVYWRLERE